MPILYGDEILLRIYGRFAGVDESVWYKPVVLRGTTSEAQNVFKIEPSTDDLSLMGSPVRFGQPFVLKSRNSFYLLLDSVQSEIQALEKEKHRAIGFLFGGPGNPVTLPLDTWQLSEPGDSFSLPEFGSVVRLLLDTGIPVVCIDARLGITRPGEECTGSEFEVLAAEKTAEISPATIVRDTCSGVDINDEQPVAESSDGTVLDPCRAPACILEENGLGFDDSNWEDDLDIEFNGGAVEGDQGGPAIQTTLPTEKDSPEYESHSEDCTVDMNVPCEEPLSHEDSRGALITFPDSETTAKLSTTRLMLGNLSETMKEAKAKEADLAEECLQLAQRCESLTINTDRLLALGAELSDLRRRKEELENALDPDGLAAEETELSLQALISRWIGRCGTLRDKFSSELQKLVTNALEMEKEIGIAREEIARRTEELDAVRSEYESVKNVLDGHLQVDRNIEAALPNAQSAINLLKEVKRLLDAIDAAILGHKAPEASSEAAEISCLDC